MAHSRPGEVLFERGRAALRPETPASSHHVAYDSGVIRPVLHGVSVDHKDLRGWLPDDPDVVGITLRLRIGSKSGRRAPTDDFAILLATPAGLDAGGDTDGVIALRKVLVVRRYDYDLVHTFLERTIASCEAHDWARCAERLSTYFDHEFDFVRWMPR
jgi:hypothetical protein